jgi:hypothetical protein
VTVVGSTGVVELLAWLDGVVELELLASLDGVELLAWLGGPCGTAGRGSPAPLDFRMIACARSSKLTIPGTG